MSELTTRQPLATIHEAAAHHGRFRPDEVAIYFSECQLTFAELHRASNQTAHALLGSALGPGARVAYFGKDSAAYFEIAIACAKTGMVLVPVNWRLSRAEIEHILVDSRAGLLFVAPEFEPVLGRLSGGLPCLAKVVRLDGRWRDGMPDADVVPADPAGPISRCYRSIPAARPGCPRASCSRTAASSPFSMRWPRARPPGRRTGSSGFPAT